MTLVDRAYVPERIADDLDRSRWPFTVPCVAQLLDEGLTFTAPVTFLVGENGSGKSTLVEAFAEAFGLDAQGGKAGRKYGNERGKTPLGDRKSTRLNSSHGYISYAVFCL